VPTHSIAIGSAVAAGFAGGLQLAVNGAFGRRIGVLEAACFASVVTVVTLTAITLVSRGGLGGVAHGLRLPPWLWLGGLCSAVLITCVTYSTARIGGLGTGALLIAGQLCVVVLADTFGWFGLQRIALSPQRIAGLPLLALAAFLVLKR
jgi:bacterial/archaeal transporter family-2 protein